MQPKSLIAFAATAALALWGCSPRTVHTVERVHLRDSISVAWRHTVDSTRTDRLVFIRNDTVYIRADTYTVTRDTVRDTVQLVQTDTVPAVVEVPAPLTSWQRAKQALALPAAAIALALAAALLFLLRIRR